MRKLIVLAMISLDGVMQAPGGPDEDTDGGFTFGGWVAPFFDEFFATVMDEQLDRPFDLLLGRRTYEIFASYWPHQTDPTDRVAVGLNKARKYVASRRHVELPWRDSVPLSGDIVEAVRALKASDGPDLQVHGSTDLLQTLLAHDLVDKLWLKTVPVVLGSGKRLFGEGAIPAGFAAGDVSASPLGVVFATYERAGDVRTGLVGD
jgi:dihydrofolate reductase